MFCEILQELKEEKNLLSLKVGHGEGGDENIKNGLREREKGRTFDNLFSHRLGAAVRHLLEMAEAENEFSLMYFIRGSFTVLHLTSCSRFSIFDLLKILSDLFVWFNPN